jgi:DNA-binding CsgD family transcriptional regulator
MSRLTEREAEIMRLRGDGRTLSEIADRFGLAYKTVANDCTRLEAKLALGTTNDLVRASVEIKRKSARVQQEETGCRETSQPALGRALQREWRGRCADDRGS